MSRLPRQPGLLLLASLFWGWHSGQLLAGLGVGALLELTTRSQWRWEFGRSELHRIADLCTLLISATGVYLYFAGSLAELVLGLLQWSPLLFAPLLLAQLLGGLPAIPLSALFYSMRRRGDGGRTIDLYLPYVLLCLLAAAVSAQRTPWYYFGLLAMLLLLLWRLGGLARHPRSGVALFMVAAMLGYAGQYGLVVMQARLEEQVVAWLSALFQSDIDPYRATTAIGEVGTLKFSGWVRYRVHADQLPPGGLLLRDAAYNSYFQGQWVASDATFGSLSVGGSEGMQWRLTDHPAAAPSSQLTISAKLDGGDGVLPMPSGAWQLGNLPVGKVERNRMGALRVSEGPALIDYQVSYLPTQGLAGVANEQDLALLKVQLPLLDRVLAPLALDHLPLAQRVAGLVRYFDQGFSYSLTWAEAPPASNPLELFLLQRHAGHCEYYATATTLLLRRLGIPARYVRGFLLDEYSPLEGAYVVRTRHAHAWSEYWDGHSWQALDNTPSVWLDMDEEQSAVLQPLYDLFAWFGHRFTRLSQGGLGDDRSRWLWWLLPLVALLGWRLARQRRGRSESSSAKADDERMAADALLVTAERHLHAAGQPRRSGETLQRWFGRIEREHPGRYRLEQLQPLLPLHYRQRFGVQPPSAAELERAQGLVDKWLRGQQQG